MLYRQQFYAVDHDLSTNVIRKRQYAIRIRHHMLRSCLGFGPNRPRKYLNRLIGVCFTIQEQLKADRPAQSNIRIIQRSWNLMEKIKINGNNK